MGAHDLARTDRAPAPALGASRTRVLAVLQDAGASLSVNEIAHRLGLHPNTARFHLDALVEAGAAERAREERERPGRPRALYAARPEVAPAGERSYRLLAEILTSCVAVEAPQPSLAAMRAGQAWGRHLAQEPPSSRRPGVDAATDQLVGAMAAIGFAPEAVAVGRRRQVLLHRCPFREAAEQHQEIVCSIHLGLMRGMLAGIDAPIDAERLDPFVEPDLCVASLARRTNGMPAVRARKG